MRPAPLAAIAAAQAQRRAATHCQMCGSPYVQLKRQRRCPTCMRITRSKWNIDEKIARLRKRIEALEREALR